MFQLYSQINVAIYLMYFYFELIYLLVIFPCTFFKSLHCVYISRFLCVWFNFKFELRQIDMTLVLKKGVDRPSAVKHIALSSLA